MSLSTEIQDKLRRAFGDGPECAISCALIDFLRKRPDTSHITLQLVKQLVKKSHDEVTDVAVLRTLQYLSGGTVQILRLKFELFDLIDDEVAPYILSDEEAAFAVHDDINPITGEVDPELKQKIGIFFEPAANLPRLFSSSDDQPHGGCL